MKCFVDVEDWNKSWRAMLPAGATNAIDASEVCGDDRWYDAILRVEVNNGALSLVGPFGTARVPAQVERKGVLFLLLREYVERAESTFDEPVIMLEATPEFVQDRYQRFLCQPWEFGLFDDPATAPHEWQPTETEKDYYPDWSDEEETPGETTSSSSSV